MPINTQLKRTNSREFRAMVFAYLADAAYSFDDTGLPDTQSNRARHMWERFDSEYNYSQNRIRIPSLQLRVAEWLSGLAINIEYTYCDIIARAEQWHETKLTDKQADAIIDQWFKFLAMSLIQMWNKHGVATNG